MSDDRSGPTVLITGASGFAGSYLAEECARRGCQVHGTTRPGEAVENLSASSSVTLHTVELSDMAAVRALVDKVRPSQIYHLAAQASVQKAWHDPMATLTNNIAAQLGILTAAREVTPNARVLIVSSSEVYGRVDPARMPVDEDAPLGPLDPYAVSKVTQEMLGLQHFLAFDQPVVRVRPFNHAGPRQRLGFVVADFAYQVALIEAGSKPPIVEVGNLAAVRDISDVRDVVRAYTLALCEGEPGAVYNIGSGRGISMDDLLHMFIGQSRVAIEARSDQTRLRPIDRPSIVGNAARLRARTGWSPSISLDQTVQDTLAYWREKIARAAGAGGSVRDE